MKLTQINTIAHGTIEKVHKDKQLVDVKVGYLLRYETTREVVYQEFPIIQNVPLIMLQGGGAKLKFAVKKGDFCLLLFTQRGSRDFLKQGGLVKPSYAGIRMFDINDGFALVGFNAFNKPYEIPDDGIVLESANKKNSIKLDDNGITLTAGKTTLTLKDGEIKTSTGNYTIESTGNLNINATNTMKLNANTIEIKGNTTARMIGNTSAVVRCGQSTLSCTASDMKISGLSTSIKSTLKTSIYGTTGIKLVSLKTTCSGALAIFGWKPVWQNVQVNESEDDIDIPEGEDTAKGALTVYGRTTFLGDFDVALYNKDEEPELPDDTIVATSGTLTSGTISDASLSFAKQESMDVAIGYNHHILKLTPGTKTPNEIASELSTQLEDSGTVEFKDNSFVITTTGTGFIEGYIDYASDITTNTNPTSAMLQTGQLMDFGDFKQAVNSNYVSFVQYVDTERTDYEILNLEAINNWSEFAQQLNKDNVKVDYLGNQLVFTSKKTGTLESSISELRESSYLDKVNYLISSYLSDEDVQNLSGKKLGFAFNGLKYVIDIPVGPSLPLIASLIEEKINSSVFLTSDDAGSKINIVTFDAISYFSNIDNIPEQLSTLNTSSLLDFSQFSQAISYQNISFTYKNAIVTLNKGVYNDYNAIAQAIQQQIGEDTCSYDENLNNLKFASANGDASYLSKGNDSDIDGSLILFGTEELGAWIVPHADEVVVELNSADLLKLSQASEATIKTFNEDENLSVPVLLKGTKLLGATITEAKNSEKIIVSNLASRLKLTEKTGAKVKTGREEANFDDLGVPYDGTMKLKGALHVANEVKAEKFIAQEIEVEQVLKTTEIEAQNALISQKTNTKELTVVGDALFNDNCTYNSNIILQNSSKVTNENETTYIMLNEDGIDTSTKIKTKDVEFKK